jgi:FkbM family methyltransferase
LKPYLAWVGSITVPELLKEHIVADSTASEQRWRYQDNANVDYRDERKFPLRLRLLRWIGRQNWIPKGQHALLCAICHPDRQQHYYFDIDFFGRRYRGDLAHFIDWLVFCYGAAPYPEVLLLRDLTRHMRQKGAGSIAFYDIGANVGHHALFMSELADLVYAFEPSPDLVAAIHDKIALNQLANVTVLPYALGESDGEIAYFPGLGSNSGAGSLIPSFPGVSDQALTVAIRRGDALIDDLNLPKLGVVKIDVQGFEPQVLRGLSSRIRQDRPAILSEMTDEARAGYGSETAFRACFYDNASFAEIVGGFRRFYKLAPFSYSTSQEVLILPPELADFIRHA